MEKKNQTFEAFLLFGRETTAGIVKPDLFPSEKQTRRVHNIPHPHSSLIFILVCHRIEQKHYRVKELKLNTEWAHQQIRIDDMALQQKGLGFFNN